MVVSINPHHLSSQSTSLLAELHAQASKLTHADLTLRLRAANDTLASVSHRHSELCKELAQADAATRKREVQLMLERGCVIETDSELASLRGEQAHIKEGLRALNTAEGASKQLRAVLRNELETRAALLEREVTQKVQKNWKGTADECIQAAREQVAKAIIAVAHQRTERPEGVQPSVLLSNWLGEAEICKSVQTYCDEERAKERAAIIKRNPHLGSV